MKLNNRGWSLSEEIILMVILFICLLVATYYIIVFYNSVAKNSENIYTELENKIRKGAIKYTNTYGQYSVITSEMLTDESLLPSFIDNQGEYCVGYVLIINDIYNPYIKCDNYTTKNFNDKYLK